MSQNQKPAEDLCAAFDQLLGNDVSAITLSDSRSQKLDVFLHHPNLITPVTRRHALRWISLNMTNAQKAVSFAAAAPDRQQKEYLRSVRDVEDQFKKKMLNDGQTLLKYSLFGYYCTKY